MKKFCSFIVIFCLKILGQGQQINVDSLTQALQDAKADSNKVILLQQLGFYYNDAHPDKNLDFQQQALDLAKKIGFKRGELTSIAELGFLAMVKGNYPTALELSFIAKKQSQHYHFDSLTAEINNNIGLAYYYMGDFVAAKKFLYYAKEILDRKDYALTSMLVRGNLGRAYLRLNNFDSALFFCSEAYRIASQRQLFSFQSPILIALGEANEKLGNESIAYGYYQQATQISTRLNNARQQSQAFQRLAQFYYHRSRDDSALNYVKRGLFASTQGGYQQNIMESAVLLAHIYERQHQIDSAYKYLSVSVKARNEMFAQEKQSKIQELMLSQILNDLESDQKEQEERSQRKQNLRYSILAFCIVNFLLLFFLFSHSIIAKPKMIRFLGILSLLIVFEFINLFIHPYLDKWTNHSIPMMLGIMVCIAALLIPMHHKLEHWITHQLVEKNNRIRLAAARKTIADLDG